MNGTPQIRGIVRFSLTTADAPALAAFYARAFGGVIVATECLDRLECERSTGVTDRANRITLSLGTAIIELVQFEQPGMPYPPGSPVSDLVFQHFALVASDIAGAWQRLADTPGWSAITQGEPQKLPQASGGVTAFKFRDPEGHPLELLEFPTGKTPVKWTAAHGGVLGIDHSAIGVRDVAVSTAFYRRLGFHVASKTHNVGPEQSRLDGIADADVRVIGLVPKQTTPHLELLCYKTDIPPAPNREADNDIAATRLVLAGGKADAGALADPDRHRLVILPGPI